ncbi:fumarylacetoacetate (FAA) hydrolase [Caldalkalibacillus uzonensis]|uniref:Fumarylacetoacetate (FAA) hydrolase n=1 Tax=Caldalkalibacillus uzonensis TaxID=353224 RepID=A0ABU0CR55_9BACI|nr:fumarylacetoacetate hydrolase family protein [Caldalkalibacillus uzonensis]MDQ0338902.1 fumarylacetoacetate (FAA) hydrolase [Caldalkalibacillus uzonensis]
MKFLAYEHPRLAEVRAGVLLHHHVVDLSFLLELTEPQAAPPSKLLDYLQNYESWKDRCYEAYRLLSNKWELADEQWVFPSETARLKAPLPRPASVRDFYAFEAHVKTCRQKRGLSMVEEWYQFPVFYFSNHQAIIGPYETVSFPHESARWDFELEVAVIIGRKGRNIPRSEAFHYIFGLTMMNDWSARDIQAQEVKVGLGPAKGKDFATSLGPFVVTAEEWWDKKDGETLDLTMEAYRNGQRMTKGNLKELYFSIPQLIERASQDCTLYPGDVLGTGTVGGGCLLEQDNPEWLKPGDEISLRVERLGVLTNTVG